MEEDVKSVPQVSQLFIGHILTVKGVKVSDDAGGSESVIIVSTSSNSAVLSIVISSMFR